LELSSSFGGVSKGSKTTFKTNTSGIKTLPSFAKELDVVVDEIEVILRSRRVLSLVDSLELNTVILYSKMHTGDVISDGLSELRVDFNFGQEERRHISKRV
jgi:hypothetical protein